MPEAPTKASRPKRILARSLNFSRDKGLIEIQLSKPDEGEECAITLEPIAEARLDFLPTDKHVAGPSLRKATLPCGHSFSALAVLYHFAKNGMRCPSCRAGVEARMTPQSIPHHLRAAFVAHMEREADKERDEQVLADMRVAADMLESEVNGGPSFYLDRVVVFVYAFEAMDSLAPVSAQTIPLRMMPAHGDRSRAGGSGPSSSAGSTSASTSLMRFESAGYSCRQVGINLRLMGADVRAYELVVGTRDLFDGVVMLCRTARFPAVQGQGQLQCHGGGELHVAAREHSLERVEWAVNKEDFMRALASR